jgi:hypothetical protein
LITGNYANAGMAEGASELWGYDPTVLSRYAQFMAITQGSDPDTANMYQSFRWYCPLYRLLRCSDVITKASSGSTEDLTYKNPLPHVFFAQNYEVFQGRDQIFTAAEQKGFDPGRTAILEQSTGQQPGLPLGTGAATIETVNSDRLTIKADNSAPSLLIITDNYSSSWHASSLPGDTQSTYQVLPADYTIMAIPLQAGHHFFTLQYLPKFFVLAEWISAISTFAFVVVGSLKLFILLTDAKNLKRLIQ